MKRVKSFRLKFLCLSLGILTLLGSVKAIYIQKIWYLPRQLSTKYSLVKFIVEEGTLNILLSSFTYLQHILSCFCLFPFTISSFYNHKTPAAIVIIQAHFTDSLHGTIQTNRRTPLTSFNNFSCRLSYNFRTMAILPFLFLLWISHISLTKN